MNAPQPHVWFAVQRFGLGGAERAAVDWINALVRSGVKVTGWAWDGNSAGFQESRLDSTVRVFRGHSEIVFDALRHEHPTALVVDIVEGMIPLVPALSLLADRLVLVVHSLGEWSRKFLHESIRGYWRKVIVISPQSATDALQAGATESQVVYVANRMDVAWWQAPAWDSSKGPMSKAKAREFRNLPDRAFVFGYVGRACWGKRLVQLATVLAYLRKTGGVNAHLALAGLTEKDAGKMSEYWDTCRAEFYRVIDGFGLRPFVHEFQPTTDVRPFYRACDATILLSVSEGSPCAVWESLACGTPVVTTNVGDVALSCTPETGSFIVDQEAVAPNLEAVAAGRLLQIAKRAQPVKRACFRNARNRVLDLRGEETWEREYLPRLLAAMGVE